MGSPTPILAISKFFSHIYVSKCTNVRCVTSKLFSSKKNLKKILPRYIDRREFAGEVGFNLRYEDFPLKFYRY